ncbi:MAG: agmatine deiminase, partial [Pseudomonas sp.]
MTTLNSTPRADGFHMPAEWAPHSQTWMVWPQRSDNWRLGGKPAQAAFTAVAKAIARFEPVTVCVSAEQYENARARLDADNIRVVEISTDDAWVRDTGPTFVRNAEGVVRGVDWGFNAWGGFDGGLYAPWQRDDQVASKILEIERRDRYRTEGFVLEGGSIHVDGEGTVITTEECLLNRNRNPGWTEEIATAALARSLGAKKVLWLGEGLVNDHTDGHVDNLARFIAPATVAIPVAWGRGDPNAPAFDDAAKRLAEMTDAEGRKIKVVRIPSPGWIEGEDKRPVPASHMNFLIANGAV